MTHRSAFYRLEAPHVTQLAASNHQREEVVIEFELCVCVCIFAFLVHIYSCVCCMQRLDEVLHAAKEACSELESCEVADELVLDTADQRPRTGTVIRQ